MCIPEDEDGWVKDAFPSRTQPIFKFCGRTKKNPVLAQRFRDAVHQLGKIDKK